MTDSHGIDDTVRETLPTHAVCPRGCGPMNWAYVDFAAGSGKESGLMTICPVCYGVADVDLTPDERAIMQPFADAIRAARNAKQIRLLDAAKRLGTTISNYSAIERAIRRIDRCTAERIAALVGLATDESHALIDDISSTLATKSPSSDRPTMPGNAGSSDRPAAAEG